MDSQVTILIPTYNRPQELYRLLNFLESLHNNFAMIIMDGSTEANQTLNNRIGSQFGNITYLKFAENCHLATRFQTALNDYVKTPYVVFCPDDDFIIPSMVLKASEFLADNPIYSAVNGQVRCLAYPKKNLGFFAFLNHLAHPLMLEQQTFLARYLHLAASCEAGCPPLFYAVRRTSQVKKIFNIIPDTFKYSSMEMLSNALTLMWGKARTLPELMMIRNYSSATTRDAIREDPIYYVAPEDALLIRKVLAKELRVHEGILSDEIINYTLDQFIKLPLTQTPAAAPTSTLTPFATRLQFKKNWFFYLLNYLYPAWQQKFDVDLNEKLLRALKKSFITQNNY